MTSDNPAAAATAAPAVRVRHVQGDLLEQPVEVLVNARNHIYMPRWLLVPPRRLRGR